MSNFDSNSSPFTTKIHGRMKRFLTCFTISTALFLIIPLLALSQDFDEAMELYENQQYEQAASIFSELNDSRSILFAGKSYFDMQQYTRANQYLSRAIQESSELAYRQEALYTLALSHFGMKSYTKSLDLLHELIVSDERGRARVDAQRFFRELLQYLTFEQRMKAIQATDYNPVARQLAESAYDIENDSNYEALVSAFLERIINSDERQDTAQELVRPSRLTDINTDSFTPLAPPEGLVYNLGVVLPANEEQSNDLLVPRNLYYGITMAADDFNSRFPNKKVALKFRNTHQNADSTAMAFHDVVWNGYADAVIGPLFSESAERLAGLAENYRIPMIAPLANSDEINLDYNYTFQMNPTFEVHGRMMARHAVQELGLDTLAVIGQEDALGTASARSFRQEAERLGAFISYYYEEDFSESGYDLTEFTEVFTSDVAEQDSMNYIPTQGIYAPFTGQAANTLVNLLMTDLEVLGSDMVVMGSEEWEEANLSGWQNRNFEIYYSQVFGGAADTSDIENFETDFENRFGIEADNFSKLGYDIATYILNSLDEAGNPDLLQHALRHRAPLDGLSIQIDMNGKRINQHVYIRPLTDPAIERVSNR